MLKISVIIFFITLIIVLILTRIQHRFVNYNKNVYKWHCDNLYPFHTKLTIKESAYIEKCIDLSWWELLRPFYLRKDPFIKRLSYFTYSHRVIRGKVNSSRIAYGSVINPDIAYELAKEILNERGIKSEILTDNNIIFGGLGWDFEEGHFKTYSRFKNFKNLSSNYQKLLGNMQNKCKYGIISITYDTNGNILERKVYCYSKKDNIAELRSEFRHDIQRDCNGQEKWNLNTTGNSILELYRKSGYKLDTITYKV
jgi:hypothetical protein